jgi:drug/metabolite transporter (DMT)-like permease
MPALPRLLDRPYLLLTLTPLFWAGNAVIGRAVVGEIPPIALAQIRWLLAAIIVMPFAWRSVRAELPVIRRHIGVLVLLSLTGITAFNTLQYWSLQYTTAINVSVMQSASPLLIGLWSWMLWRDPLTRGQLAGIVTSLAGVLAIISGGELTRLASLRLNAGDVAILIATAIYALYSALLRQRPGIAPISFLAVTITVGAVLLVPFSAAEYATGARLGHLSPGGYAAIAYVAIFPSLLAYMFFNRGVQLIGANRAGPFFHLIPLFGSALAIAFLGERPGWHHLAGACLIIGGVFVAGRSKRRRSDEGGNRVADGKHSP